MYHVTESDLIKLSLSDHYMIYCNRPCKQPRLKPKVLNVRSFKNFDPLGFVSDLRNLPWDTIYLFDSPEDAWFAMQDFLKDIGNKCAPLRSIRVHGSQPPWMTDEIRQAIKSCDAMKRKADKGKPDNVWTAFKRLRNAVTRLIEVAKREYFNSLLTDHTKDTSNIWTTLKKLLPKKKKVALHEIILDKTSYTSDQGMATNLSKFFTSVAERLKSTQSNQVSLIDVSDIPNLASVKNFEFKDISVDFVHKELSSLKVNKSSGPQRYSLSFSKNWS